MGCLRIIGDSATQNFQRRGERKEPQRTQRINYFICGLKVVQAIDFSMMKTPFKMRKTPAIIGVFRKFYRQITFWSEDLPERAAALW